MTKLGNFTVRDEEDDDPISVGSLFAKRKMDKSDVGSPTGTVSFKN